MQARIDALAAKVDAERVVQREYKLSRPTLQTAGADPRLPWAAHACPGESRRYRTSTQMDMGGLSPFGDVSMPGFEFVVAIGSVDASGAFDMVATVVHVDAITDTGTTFEGIDVRRLMQRAVPSVGESVAVRVEPGVRLRLLSDAKSASLFTLANLVCRIAYALPAEPFGVGAAWPATMNEFMGGFPATYNTKLDASAVVVEMSDARLVITERLSLDASGSTGDTQKIAQHSSATSMTRREFEAGWPLPTRVLTDMTMHLVTELVGSGVREAPVRTTVSQTLEVVPASGTAPTAASKRGK